MSLQLKRQDLLKNGSYVGARWLTSESDISVLNPASGDEVARVADAAAHDVSSAIDCAATAFPSWAAKTAKERGQILRKWFDLVIAHKEDLARIMVAEQGKPMVEARAEIDYGASFIEWYSEEAKRAYGDVYPTTVEGGRMEAVKQPVGVCGAITPWNFPVAMITRKAAPALAAGCTMIVKPSELTPLSALALAELAEEAGVPQGVLNIVVSSDSAMVGQVLCNDARVRKLSFTGSTRVGKILMEQSAQDLKRLSMELGGNAPFIVFEDADIDAAVAGAVASKFRNAGQTCVCANRFYIHETLYDEFAAKFSDAVSVLRVGNGAKEGTEIGPLIEAKAIDKVHGLVSEAVEAGAYALCGGAVHDYGAQYYQPTVLTDVTQDMRIAREEIFGPVAPLFKFSTEDDVVAMANQTEYGLAAYFYARDVGRVHRVAQALHSGIVCVNAGGFSTEVAPFGGVKHSGFGREASRYGLDEYLDLKYVFVADLNR